MLRRHAALAGHLHVIEFSDRVRVCARQLLVPEVVRHYKGRYPDPGQSLSEQTILNTRPSGNPNQTIHREWEKIAQALVTTPLAPFWKDGMILGKARSSGPISRV